MNPITRKIISLKKDILRNNIVIKKETSQKDRMLLLTKKIQESQNKIIDQKNSIELTKGIIPDPNKRQFIKKGILGIIMGIGIAVFSKITRSVENIKFDDDTVALNLETAGHIIKPNQPAFNAVNTSSDSNVTGDETLTTIDFDSESFDQNGDFASDTFTAPVTGRYLLCVTFTFTGIVVDNGNIIGRIVTSNRTYNRRGWPTASNSGSISMSVVADMDAADTVTVIGYADSEGSDIVDVEGSASSHFTHFSGCLIA
tara:strand:+ start:2949 stop:3719 length:771 start_codon:yes stop_codon:yes gene_type:complete